MIVHKWKNTKYEQAVMKMYEIHKKALQDGQNHLILTQHDNCYTVGKDEWNKQWNIPVIKSDRGGSVTSHGRGQNIYYFCFQAPSAVSFFKKVIKSFKEFFDELDKDIKYDKTNPGFYIRNKKLCSLGFRYKNGVSLHGVSLNVNIDQNFHARINPCNLSGVTVTSLKNEDIHISCEEVNNKIVSSILKNFNESL